MYVYPEMSLIDHQGDKTADLEAARESAREEIAEKLRDGEKVLFEDGESLQLTDEMTDSYIRRVRDGY